MIQKYLKGMAVAKRTKPWPHVYIHRMFDPYLYTALLLQLPGIEEFTTLNDYKEYRRVWTLDNGKPGTIWAELNEVLTGDYFTGAMSKLLGVTRVMYPRPALIYDLPGYSIPEHRDASFKVATMIVYLPEDDSQQSLGTHLISESYRKQLGFFPNTGVLFAPGKNSLHEVPETPKDSGMRKTLHICFFDTPEREFK